MTLIEFIRAFMLVMLLMAAPVGVISLLKWGLGRNRRFLRDKEQYYKA